MLLATKCGYRGTYVQNAINTKKNVSALWLNYF